MDSEEVPLCRNCDTYM